MIRVLVADDSPTARALIVAILSRDAELCVVGEAAHGLEAVALTRQLRPDIVTMDLRMPRMDGMEATQEIMATIPTPVIIVTASLAREDIEFSMQCLKLGALAILAKPTGPDSPNFEEIAQDLIANVKALSQVKVVRHWRTKAATPVKKKATARNVAAPEVVAIAASTGGPAALQQILAALPEDFPAPILVVQHITAGFSKGLAEWLNKECRLHVKLAVSGAELAAGTVHIAPDHAHLGVTSGRRLMLDRSPPLHGFRPSGNYLFTSAARVFGDATLAVILTGMGEDGVEGLQAVRQAGGHVLAQDEASSVVFGMPAAAIRTGVVQEVLPLEAIAARLIQRLPVG